ncbi:nucleotide sugar dehydrogenase [Kurthia massiliensis]|uniref:nucleotide sugar dehydrogenase n=1 Tax=Kurthia massiliensis TaxID=1033739 RepID=UPI000289A4C0|nr:nucleotide sugar dehydrogenase [Kurthia massiliensis]
MKNYNIGIVGLGYVGLPVAVAFGKKQSVVGFDINESRIEQLKNGMDITNEVSPQDLMAASIAYTSDPIALEQCNFLIISVPTPINEANQPDLTPILAASKTVGQHLQKGTIVVYESTVYPGLTEEECVPILERHSGLKVGIDFHIGYSPERINPGDKVHTFTNIKKVVSGETPAITDEIADVYSQVVEAGVHKASSIKVAEAAKIIENTQRDVNIALMNELALIFDTLDINTAEVLKAANTKWNFLDFKPGLVGGHCIGVDPYYLTYKAEQAGYMPEMILAGRRLNDALPQYIASMVVKKLAAQDITNQDALITVLGLTFKENVPDIRNTKVANLIKELEEYGVSIQVHDPLADSREVFDEYQIRLSDADQLQKADAVILAVPHEAYTEKSWSWVTSLLKREDGIVMDIKSCLDPSTKPALVKHWNL